MSYRINITSQAGAARLAGLSLLVLIISGLFSNFFVSSNIVDTDAVKTAHNIVINERLFRTGLVCSLIMFNCDIIQAIALYVLLKPVNKNLALLGVFWRFANACIGGFEVLGSFYALRLATNVDYVNGFTQQQSQSLMMLFIDPKNDGSLINLIFFSLGMAVHGYLLFKSLYIPRLLAGFYLFASILLLVSTIALIIFPNLNKVIYPTYIIPDFIAELILGLWLSIKGAKIPNENYT